MAFNLLPGNLTNVSAIDNPAGLIAGPDNFIDLYTVGDKYEKALIPQLHMANGRGKVMPFLKLMGQESTYASDAIQHAEEGRLQTVATGVTFSGNVFTSPTEHTLAVKDTVLISNGVSEVQATVTAVSTDKIFTAVNDIGANFSIFGSDPVTVLCDFSNSYEKGSDDAVIGKRWNPDVYENFTHILKKVYNISGSDMVHNSWIQTPDGPRWYNHEVENSSILFDNLSEYTQFWHKRKASGSAKGVKGVLSQIENRGNIGNEYIQTIDDLDDIAFRLKQEGSCREYTIWHDHAQGTYIRTMLAGVNSHYAGGGNFGTFANNKDTALMLGFGSVYISGVTFHFTPWDLLDRPDMFGSTQFRGSGLACLIMPTGRKNITQDGNSVAAPYLSVRYRSENGQNRKKEIKLFGPGGTAHKKDIQTTHMMSEFTNQLVGANEFFAVRSGVFYS